MPEAPTVHLAAGRGDAHALLLRLAHTVTGAEFRIAHSCRECGSSSHGAIRLIGDGRRIAASLSRSGEGRAERLVVAICEQAALGVDLEGARAVSFPAFDEVALHPGEHCADDEARTRLWVRKEAVLKAMGTGLAVDPASLHLAPDGRVLVGPRVQVADVDLAGMLPGSWVCSVAVAGKLAPHVIRHSL